MVQMPFRYPLNSTVFDKAIQLAYMTTSNNTQINIIVTLYLYVTLYHCNEKLFTIYKHIIGNTLLPCL